MEPRFPPALHQELKNRFAERYSTAQAVREHHGKDESPYDPMLPDAVVFVRTTQEIIELVQACEHYRVPLIPYGAGSSIEGHLLALQGGISIDMSQMNQVLAVNAEDLTATVQAGVTRKQLNQELKSSGLFFPIDPGADATLGGMTATRASGTNAVRYGTMRENVLGLTVVTAQGKVVQTSRRAKKSSAGYDLTRLFVGSEGTLGIITEVTVKLYPQPEAISGATVHFPTVADAVNTVITTIQLGIPIARAELLDSTTLRAINAYSKTQLPEQPTLFLEFHGSPASVEEQAQTVQQIAQEHQGAEFQWATQPEQRSKLWQARHDAYFASLQLKPGCRSVTTDVCVPISRLAEVIETTRQLLSGSSLPAPLFGHVGDGNFHCAILVDPNNAAELAEAERLNEAIVKTALEHDGTCTGEHGVGLHKMAFLAQEHGSDMLDLMRAIKQAFDPLGILNPGKIVSPA